MSSSDSSRYRDAGVDLEAADAALERIRADVASTANEHVLAQVGAFGGLFALPQVERPVLVASTDGVGTKTRVAAALGGWRGIGRDLVHHCINDIAVQGARPLFFLDYLAASELDPDVVGDLVGGIAEACRAHGVALLGGETAEMPGVYVPGEVDVVGTIVGLVARDAIVDGAAIEPGDVLLGLPSGGLQTNGLSLARAVLDGRYDDPAPTGSGAATVGQAMLAGHPSFYEPIRRLLDEADAHGFAHITGGGIPGNLPRILPAGCGARLDPTAWPEPWIFGRIRELGAVDEDEMRRVFNLGVGMIAVVAPERMRAAQRAVPEAVPIGRVTAGSAIEFVEGSFGAA